MPIMIQQYTRCFSSLFTHVAHQSQPSLTTDYWPLTTAVPGGRPYSALPCAGAPPPQRPLYCSRRSDCVGNSTLASRGDRAYPNPAPWPVPTTCRRRQARRGNVRFVPPYTAMTFKSPLLKSRQSIPSRQSANRTWLGSYGNTPKQPRTSRRAQFGRESSC